MNTQDYSVILLYISHEFAPLLCLLALLRDFSPPEVRVLLKFSLVKHATSYFRRNLLEIHLFCRVLGYHNTVYNWNAYNYGR